MSKIAFIRPPIVLPIESMGSSQGFPPLGMAYLLACLKKEGHELNAIDGFGETIDQFHKIEGTNLLVNGLNAQEIADRIDEDTDYICLSSIFSNEWIYIKDIMRRALKRAPKAKLIVGGEHISGDWEYSLRNFEQDIYVVIGEGEETLVRLIEALDSKSDLSAIEGIAYKNSKGNPVRNKASTRIKKIDDIPLPLWDLIPLENYLTAGIGGSSFDRRAIPMLASRGCPYKCTFCSNPHMWGVNWFPRNVESLIAEIKLYKEKYDISHVDFFDLTTIVNKKWITTFCTRLIEEELNITWSMPAGSRSEALDENLILLLKKSGLRKMDFAPESGSQKTIKRIKKKVNLDKMIPKIKLCVKNDLVCGATLIYGFPGQTLFECFQNILFSIKLAWIGLNDLPCFPFVPYPGSELFYQLVDEGKIDTSNTRYDLFLADNVYNKVSAMKSWSEHIPNWFLPILVFGTMAVFYSLQFLLRPKRLFQLATRVLKNRPVTMIELVLYGIKMNFVSGRKLKVSQSVDLEEVRTYKRASLQSAS